MTNRIEISGAPSAVKLTPYPSGTIFKLTTKSGGGLFMRADSHGGYPPNGDMVWCVDLSTGFLSQFDLSRKVIVLKEGQTINITIC